MIPPSPILTIQICNVFRRFVVGFKFGGFNHFETLASASSLYRPGDRYVGDPRGVILLPEEWL